MEKLYDLKLSSMARALAEQLEQRNIVELCFEERLGLLVDREWQERQERRLAQRLKCAKLKQSACVEDIDYRHQRNLDRQVMQELLTCQWIRAKHNLIITGATGLGKTWLACSLADKACREGLTAIYKQAQRLTFELTLARADGSYLKLLSQLAKADLLILDDWGLAPLDGQAQHDILDVIDDRANIRSTLVTSQLPVSKWHATVGDPSVADALLDRLLHAATKIHLKGDTLRKQKTPRQQNLWANCGSGRRPSS
jgi:DNA replication protein DnaC